MKTIYNIILFAIFLPFFNCHQKDIFIPKIVIKKVIDDFEGDRGKDTVNFVELSIDYSNNEYYTLMFSSPSPYLVYEDNTPHDDYIPYEIYDSGNRIYFIVDLKRKPDKNTIKFLRQHKLVIDYPENESNIDKLPKGWIQDHERVYYYFVCRSNNEIIEKKSTIDLIMTEDLPRHICD